MRAKRNRRARAVPGVACLLLMVLALSACGHTAVKAGPRVALGPMAGYVWQGHLTSVRGTFVVPTLAAKSHDGTAATWIGAQARGASSHAPFIQVGVNEAEDGLVREDYVFWSDTVHRFAPVKLFTVAPGDRLSASLSLQAGRWTVAIRDLSTVHASKSFSTSDEGHATFDLGLWLQEDVTNRLTSPAVPVPHAVRRPVLGSGGQPRGSPLCGHLRAVDEPAQGPQPVSDAAVA